MNQPSRILIVAGGTGGHILPGTRIGRAIGAVAGNDVEIEYCCGSREIEARVYRGVGVDPTIYPVGSQAGVLGKAKYLASMARCFAGALTNLISRRPSAVVATGGAVCFPILSAATLLRVPIFLHESNAIPGRVVRLFARFSTQVFTGFQIEGLANEIVVGTPGPIGTDKCIERDTVLCVGGSQGAARLNGLFLQAAMALRERYSELRFVLIAGPGKEITASEGVEVMTYCDDMAELLSRTRAIVSRSGSGSLCDIAAFAIPSILVPFPHAKDDHQTSNARCFADSGAAVLMPETQLSAGVLTEKLDAVLSDEGGLGTMAHAAKKFDRPDAANEIARRVLLTAAGRANRPTKLREGIAVVPPKS